MKLPTTAKAGDGSPFSRKTLAWIGGVSLVSIALFVVIAVVPRDEPRRPTAGADSYSYSAVGHRAFRELLAELGIPVVVSRYQTALRHGRDALLVLAEPSAAAVGAEPRSGELARLVTGRGPTILVLPKWEATPSSDNPNHAESVAMISTAEVDEVLAAAGLDDVAVARPKETHAWSVGPPVAVSVDPVLDEPQLLTGAGLAALDSVVSCDQGTLVGFDSARNLYVVSDPDLLANHGLAVDRNAALVTALVEEARPFQGPVIIDETIHGYERPPGLMDELGRFPLVLAVAHIGLLVVLLLWASLKRFGAVEEPPPDLDPGKLFLIANTADLLQLGGFHREALRRYWTATLAETARALHAPAATDRRERLRWLARIGEVRRSSLDVVALDEQVQALTVGSRPPHARRVVALARRIHRWKQEMVHGPDGRPHAA